MLHQPQHTTALPFVQDLGEAASGALALFLCMLSHVLLEGHRRHFLMTDATSDDLVDGHVLLKMRNELLVDRESAKTDTASVRQRRRAAKCFQIHFGADGVICKEKDERLGAHTLQFSSVTLKNFEKPMQKSQ